MFRKEKINFDELTPSYQTLILQKKHLISYIIVTCIIFIIDIVLGCLLIRDYQYVLLARNGIDDTAIVIDWRYYDPEDESDYYKIWYEYEINGETYKGSCKVEDQIYAGEIIAIKHNGGAKSVIATYPTNFFVAEFQDLIIFASTCMLTIFMLILSINMSKKYKFCKRVESGEGTKTYAKFVCACSDSKKLFFKIKYEYRDGFGKLRRSKSKSFFIKEDVDYFKNKEVFEIVYIGKYSDIIEKTKSEIDLEEEMKTEEEKQTYKCLYCGVVMKEDEYECPACKAIRK